MAELAANGVQFAAVSRAFQTPCFPEGAGPDFVNAGTTGTVTVDCYGEGDLSTPFGGYKSSGFGGRDNGIHAHDQYTELKTIWVDLSDPAAGDEVE